MRLSSDLFLFVLNLFPVLVWVFFSNSMCCILFSGLELTSYFIFFCFCSFGVYSDLVILFLKPIFIRAITIFPRRHIILDYYIISCFTFILKLCIWVCVSVCGYPWIPEDDIVSPVAGVAGSCKPLNIGSGT